jgi:hypothetical protein
MKSVKIICIIISFFLFVCFESIYCHISGIPKVYVQINNPNLFSKKDFAYMVKLIKGRLKKDFDDAWDACEKKIASLPDCYKMAFNDYKNLIKTQYSNKFVIHFDFTENFIKYQILKGLDFSQDYYPGNHSGNARPAPPSIKGHSGLRLNEKTIYNVYAEKWFVIKYYKKTENCSYEYILTEVDKYLCEKGFKAREDYDILKNYLWNTSKKVYFSLKNMIIHEIFHIVLVLASNKDLKSRFADEATISDTVLKLSPLPQGNKGAYEYYYEFISWILDHERKITLRQYTVIDYVRKNFYKENKREFNPPLVLEYNNKGYTLNGYCTYIPVGGEMTKADDCRCNKMQNYVIPRKCCK